jgi:hypothetical protein
VTVLSLSVMALLFFSQILKFVKVNFNTELTLVDPTNLENKVNIYDISLIYIDKYNNRYGFTIITL